LQGLTKPRTTPALQLLGRHLAESGAGLPPARLVV